MYTIIDAHCHVYPDAIAEKAARATDAFYGVIGKHNGTLSELMAANERAGVCHSLICSVATTAHQVHSANKFIAGIVEKDPVHFSGFGTLYPDCPDVEADLDEAIAFGLKGIKIHPDIQKFAIDDPLCREICWLCEKKGMPMLFHTGDPRYNYSNPQQLLPILRDYPDLVVIGAHFGGYQNWDEAVQQLYGHPNFYVDCSSALFALSPMKARELIDGFGVDHVFFGTDYPMWDPKKEVEKFMALELTEEERQLILAGNAQRVLKVGVEE